MVRQTAVMRPLEYVYVTESRLGPLVLDLGGSAKFKCALC